MNKSSQTRARRLPHCVGDRLSETEYVDMLLPPRLHLDQLLNGETGHPYYLTSVVGVFNVATALSYMHHDRRAIKLYETVSQIILKVARHGFDSDETRNRLRKTFNIADDYIAQQSKRDLLRAVNLVEHQIKTGQATPLVASAV